MPWVHCAFGNALFLARMVPNVLAYMYLYIFTIFLEMRLRMILRSLNARYLLKSAKITGIGGTLDNKTDQKSSCRVKEAMMKVGICDVCPFEECLNVQVMPCDLISPRILENLDLRSKKFCLYNFHALPSATACSGDSGGPLVVCEGDRIVVIGVCSFFFHRDMSAENPITPVCEKQGGKSWQAFGERKRCLQIVRRACIC